ncbi:helix-turn-helix domain-containing protein [Paraburkholderia sp. BCC1886]|uniref:helix-turn-helix domain-containing protein n=1 Tax=Paraburkholderia sp. BCC1886 TaxID=2562670 RepID=UPI0011840F05|nr:helix-turn-helix transcriptional regulator [Paraburkholderia sp. BCC1886]
MHTDWRKPKVIESASRDVNPSEQDPRILLDERLEDGTVIGWHAHGFAQWLQPVEGAITVFVQERCLVVPQRFAAYIPAACLHTVTSITDSSLKTLCVPDDASRAHAMIGRAPLGVGDGSGNDAGASALPSPLQDGPLVDAVRLLIEGVRLPQDRRARPIAFRLVNQPADVRTLRDWGEELGASERTLNRIFRTEVGQGFREWRRQLLVLQTTALILAGLSVKQVAATLGYAAPSAFVAGFRSATGTTPSRFAAGIMAGD